MKKILLCLFVLLSIFAFGCKKDEETFTVKFIVNGEVVKEVEVKQGEQISAPFVESIEGMEFTNWDKDFTNINNDMEINAVFEKNKYDVNFYDNNGNLVETKEVEYGDSVEGPELEDIEGYEFIGWDVELSSITGPTDVNPIYQEKKYQVNFYDIDGNLLKTQNVSYNKSAQAPKVPQIEGYKFTGWDHSLLKITQDLDIKPTYELLEYTITYIDDTSIIKGLEPSSYNMYSEASIELPAGPEKEGFEFLGWYSNGDRVVTFFSSDLENKVYYAKYKELEKPLIIPDDCTFMFEAIKVVSTNLGTSVYQPDFTGLNVTAGATNYNWSSLHPSIATISIWSSISVVSAGYAIIRAELITDPSVVGYCVIKVNADGVQISSIEDANNKKTFKVDFMDESGNIINTQTVEESMSAELPTPPTKEGYTFVGWSGDHFNIQSDTTLEPAYVKGSSDFVGKTVSILGDSISTYKSHIPDGYSAFYPYPTADFGDVNQTWWMRVINNLGMKFHKNNSYSGSCVSTGTGSSGTTNDARLKELLKGTTAPDIILILMGANDCGSSNVSLSTFKDSYKIMLDKIKVLCPDSEIYLINLQTSGLYELDEQEKYNAVIGEYAEQYNLPLVDISNLYTKDTYKDYVVDSCHPNKAGMIAMSDLIISEMLEYKGITK